jgi:hypothetical protein
MPTNEAPQQTNALATTQDNIPTAAAILRAAVEGGITRDNVEVTERLAAMVERAEAHQAKLVFHRALFALRRTMPSIYADEEVRTKSGQLAYRYASPQTIKEALEPHLQQHGFATVVGQTLQDNMVTVTLTVIHEAGHAEERSYTTRISPGTALMSPTQCDAAATTAAERQLLIRFFGLRVRIREDDDPRNEGVYISAEQAASLRARVKSCGADETRFLAFAGVRVATERQIETTDYQLILSAKLPTLDAALTSKEHDKVESNADR